MVSGEKRNCEGDNTLERATAVLLDVEGTTTSISFVKDVLFPYVRDHIKDYVDSHWNDEEFKGDLKALKAQAEKDSEEKLENFCPIEEGENEKESVVKNILWQMDLDRKTTALKQVQGHVWREGYENGKLKGQVFSDVPPVLKKWCEDDRKIYIYSSGSVEAQKLLFKNSDAGDLETFLSGHFDTEVGPKTEASSYSNIATAIGFESSQILFLTDSVKEAVAADKAGLQVTLVIRDGNTPLTDDEKKAFTTVTSFKDIVFESSNKKKKISEEGQVEKAENVGKADEPTDIKNGDQAKMEEESNGTKMDSEEPQENAKDEPESSHKTEEEADENIVVDGDESSRTSGSGEKEVSTSVETAEEPSATATEANGESVNGHDKNGVSESKEEVDGQVNGSEANGKPEENGVTEPVPGKKATTEDQVDSTVEVTA